MKNLLINKDYSITNSAYQINFNSHKTADIHHLNEIAENLSIEKIKSINDYFYKLNVHLNSNVIAPFLSSKNKKDYLNYLKEKIHQILKFDGNYFDNVFPVRNNLLSKLLPIDNCEIPKYKHDSATGRSKIVSGTNFMTMKKEKRKLLKYKDYNVFEIDFNSCEPYFYLLSKNKIKSIETDIYDAIKSDLNLKIDDRKILKQSILSILYGAGFETVKRLSRMNKNDYNNLKAYFEIDKFENKLIKENNQLGFIYNFYERPVLVKSERSILNYWVQSSVADFCYLSFNDFISKNKINFHAIIHDAIICSSKEKFDITHLKCPYSNFKIPVSFSFLSS
jgi:hypothetical protein